MTPQETVERALALSKADGCVVIATERAETNLRWANNTLTTNGEMRSRRLAVISVVDGTAGTAAGLIEPTAAGVIERSAVDAAQLESLVRAAEQAARNAGPAEDAMPLVEPVDNHPGSAPWSDAPAGTSVEVFGAFAPALGEAFRRAGSEDRLLFGFAEHVLESSYLGSSSGLRLRHDQPTGRLEMNAKSGDHSRSVWTGQGTRDFTDIDLLTMDASLGQRLRWARNRVDLEPGRYRTILPPSAVADLMLHLYLTASARDSDEGRTVFSKKGGGSRLGERLSELPVTLRSDPAAPGLQCAPFVATTRSGSSVSVFDNGAPVPAVEWISGGVLANLRSTRFWAQRSGGRFNPSADNLLMDSADGTGGVDDLVAGTDRGLLLTCLWYIRTVDPRTELLTGLTRDGVYLVEGGEVVAAVNNFRFNDSPLGMLSRLEEVGRTERTLPREWNDFFTRTAMPALRVRDFNMSTVSQGV